ncbi:MAG: hypothetical protein ACE5HX_17005, partial [bacterium]
KTNLVNSLHPERNRRMTIRNLDKFNRLAYNSWFPEFTSGLTMKIPMLIFFALLFDDLISLFGFFSSP